MTPLDRRRGNAMRRGTPPRVCSVLFRMTTNRAFGALGAYR